LKIKNRSRFDACPELAKGAYACIPCHWQARVRETEHRELHEKRRPEVLRFMFVYPIKVLGAFDDAVNTAMTK
jgi:hypothetical protein